MNWLDILFLIVMGIFAAGVLAIEILNAFAKYAERPRRKEEIAGIKPMPGAVSLGLTRNRRRLYPFFQ